VWLHPINSNHEIEVFIEGLRDIVQNYEIYAKNDTYFPKENIFRHRNENDFSSLTKAFFEL